jgi:predicted dehydrogenase
MSEIRVGLIGYGLAGSVFHAPLVAATPGMRLAAIVTSDPDRGNHAASRYPSARILPDADALWRNAGELDLIVVASPNRTHVPLATAALAHGVAVVVDKPLAGTAAEALRLIEQGERRGVPLTVFQNRRWDGDFLTVCRLLAGNSLGDVFRFESRFERWRPALRGGWRERGGKEEVGGLLYDLGSHLIDQALVLFGPVTHVYAELDRRRSGAEVDDDSFVALTHASGVRSHLWVSSLAAQVGPRFRVLGRSAAYVKYGLDIQEDALRGGASPADPAFGLDPPDRWGMLDDGTSARAVQTEAGAYREFYAAVTRTLREGAPVPVDPLDAVRTLEVIETAQRYARAES